MPFIFNSKGTQNQWGFQKVLDKYNAPTGAMLFPTPTMYIAKESFTSSLPTKDTTGIYTISSNQTSPVHTMVNDATRGYCMSVLTNQNPYYFNYTIKSAITVSFWFKWNGTSGGWAHQFAICNSGGGTSYGTQTNTPATNLYITESSGAGIGNVNFASCPAITQTNPSWAMYTITYNGATLGLYVNGTAYSVTDAYTTGLINAAGIIVIGGRNTTYSSIVNTLVSSIYVWDQVLTPAQINSVYANT